jgi:quinolinate synthase
MAESVRAMLDTSGFETVPVYRLSEKAIGCSLAEAAEGKEYRAWLEKAKNTPNR